MTLPEVLLWRELKAAGLKFRRQHPVGSYIADFYCAAARLIVEVDGASHDMGDHPERDAARGNFLNAKGYTVLRLTASSILADVSAAAETVVQTAIPLRQSLRDCHLPTSGEDV